MTPFYALIYILAYSESYNVAQKLSHKYVCVCVYIYIYKLFSINTGTEKLSKYVVVTISYS
jgi:hypothetical protein